MINKAARILTISRHLAFIPLAVATLMVVVNSDPWRAAAQSPPCGITHVTATTGILSYAPALNGDGSLVAFASAGNFTGQNSDGNTEIFTYNTSTNAYTQITQTLGPASNSDPSISADGSRIAFISFANLSGHNPEGSQVIFLYNSATNGFTQITISPADPSTGLSQISIHPKISADGARVVFSSNADLTGENPNFANQLFLYNVAAQGIAQLTTTNGAFSNHFPSINSDGTRIAFHRLEGTGQSAIYLYNSATGLTNLTGFGPNDDLPRPSITADGSRITFASRSDLTGGNQDGNAELFLHNASNGSFTQITNTIQPTNFQPSISANGTRIAFVSNGNLTGGNNDFNPEIFLYETATGGFTQVTSSPGGGDGNGLPVINTLGTRVAFTSDRNLTGGNADGNLEVFLAACLTPPSSSTISGRVLSGAGRPITGARIVVSSPSLASPLIYYTNRRGNYVTAPLAPGATYTLTISQRRFAFSPSSRTVTLSGSNVTNADFTGAP